MGGVDQDQSGSEELLMRNRSTAESRRNVLVIQVQPGKSGEGLLAKVFQFLAGTFFIYSAVGVEGRRDRGVSGMQGGFRFLSMRRFGGFREGARLDC